MVVLPMAVNYWWTHPGVFDKHFKPSQALLRRPPPRGEVLREILIPAESRQVPLADDANADNIAAAMRPRRHRATSIARGRNVRRFRQAVSTSTIEKWWRGFRDLFLRAIQGRGRSRRREM